MTYILTDDIANFLESDAPVCWVATRNAFNKPQMTRSWGCVVNDDRQSLVLFVYKSYCLDALDNIRDNGMFAANFVNVYNYRSYQIKGSRAKLLDDLAPFRDTQRRYTQQSAELLQALGLPPIALSKMMGKSVDDYVAVHCPIDECFHQTPGPKAGEKVAV